ncbi:HRDC domain-containing protein, partial [Burkholderia pseudomallei]
ASLADISLIARESIDYLRHIPGIGARKLDRFGDEILEVVESA